jgi:hypothetical protein
MAMVILHPSPGGVSTPALPCLRSSSPWSRAEISREARSLELDAVSASLSGTLPLGLGVERRSSWSWTETAAATKTTRGRTSGAPLYAAIASKPLW